MKKTLPLLFLLYAAVALLSFSIGRYPVSPIQVAKILLSKIVVIEKTWTAAEEAVVINIRLVRIAASTLIGAALTISGLTYQTIFRNPMVSPDILGATQGAASGASIAILLGLSSFYVSAVSFVFGLFAVFLATLVSKALPGRETLGLVLGGIIIASIFQSITSFAKLVADPTNILPSITYFLLGSLAPVTFSELKFAFFPILFSALFLIIISYQINSLSFSDEEALSMGVNIKLLRAAAIIFSTVMTACSVAISGIIGWVGLVLPHITRMITGPDTSLSIPSSFFIGAAFLTAVDTISRTAHTSEIPIGILTSLVGAPFFLFLLIKEGKR